MFRHDKKHADEHPEEAAATQAETPYKEPLSQVAEEIGGGWPEDEDEGTESPKDETVPPVIPQPGQPPLTR